MERQTGAEDGAEDDLVVREGRGGLAERRLDLDGLVVQLLADLIGTDLADALQVAAEAERVLLNVYIT